MRVTIWTVAADDDNGTRATVHLSQKAAYEQWLEWQFSGELDGEEKKDREAVAALIDREDFGGVWEWKGDREFGEPMDTYAIEEHNIEVPSG